MRAEPHSARVRDFSLEPNVTLYSPNPCLYPHLKNFFSVKWHKNWVMFSLGIHTAVEITPFAPQTFNERSMGLVMS